MIAPIRPRAATVLSVIWLYLGPSSALGGIAGLAGGAAVLSLLPDPGNVEAPFFGLPACFLGATVSGVLGTAGAWKLLALTHRGRALLELANWIAVGTIALFTLIFVLGVATTIEPFGHRVVRWEGMDLALRAIAIAAVHAVPFLVMARKLRAPVVRFAVRDAEARRERALTSES
jgi:hypothetical protein